MRRRLQPVLACAAGLTASAALAQTAPAEAGKQAFEFVQAYAAATPKIDQIPRWQEPLCIGVIGLPAAQAAQVKARIEDVAKAVGVPAAPAGCSTNVEIAFTSQPQRLVDTYTKGREWILGYYDKDPGVRTVTKPVQAWYVTATIGGAGANAGWAFAFTGVPSQSGGNPTQVNAKVIDRPETWSPTGCGDSTLTSCLKSQIENVFVVVDAKAAAGKSAGLLSDYLSMVVLSQPRALGGCQPLPSIANLFVDGCAGPAPDGLTAADAAYLTALYQANPEARRANEQNDIAGRMARILAPAGVAAR